MKLKDKIRYKIWRNLDRFNVSGPLLFWKKRLEKKLEKKVLVARGVFQKAYSFFESTSEIETLAFGSSHGYYGYIAAEKEFNLCETSQDLYYSYALYEKYAGKLKNLKTIILFYSVFSPSMELQKTSESFRCVYYTAFYDIPYKLPDLAKKTGLVKDEKITSQIGKDFLRKPISKNRGNFSFDTYEAVILSAEQRAASHLKHNKRNNTQTEFVTKMGDLAKQNNHKLFVVIPPMRSDYRELLPPTEELFNALISQISDKDISLINMYDSPDFSSDDFSDTDHLNQKGAEKLTAKIKEKSQ